MGWLSRLGNIATGGLLGVARNRGRGRLRSLATGGVAGDSRSRGRNRRGPSSSVLLGNAQPGDWRARNTPPPSGPPGGGYAPGQDPNPHHPSNRLGSPAAPAPPEAPEPTQAPQPAVPSTADFMNYMNGGQWSFPGPDMQPWNVGSKPKPVAALPAARDLTAQTFGQAGGKPQAMDQMDTFGNIPGGWGG